jgi:hypothetical protein
MPVLLARETLPVAENIKNVRTLPPIVWGTWFWTAIAWRFDRGVSRSELPSVRPV